VTAYAKRFRNRVEADEENKNLSADAIAKQKTKDITLLERLMLELWYHWKTGGGHLDLVNVTLCAGSRRSDGKVPGVCWNNSGLDVGYCAPDLANDRIRFRSVI